jgi:acyl-CoA synthetase (AMP-forming)/AMP-acid ligase II
MNASDEGEAMSGVKAPKVYITDKSLPENSAGKILKRELKRCAETWVR